MSKTDDMPQPPPMPLDFKVRCEIELTEAQKRMVKAQTGRDMDVLVLADEDGKYARRMAESTPDDYQVMALRQAEMLNACDADYHAYLVALAAWEAGLNDPDEADEAAERISVAAAQEAERQKLFYMKEAEACANAREVAKIAWGKKDTPQ